MAGISEQTTGVAQDRGNAYVSAQTASFVLDTTTAPLAAVGGVLYTINNAGATTFTVPANATVAYPIGYIVRLGNIGAGTCTITAGAGATVTVTAAAAVATVTSRTIVKTAINTWLVLQ
jgi:hypothetical protein